MNGSHDPKHRELKFVFNPILRADRNRDEAGIHAVALIGNKIWIGSERPKKRRPAQRALDVLRPPAMPLVGIAFPRGWKRKAALSSTKFGALGGSKQ
jgi:hypothetical protein